MQTKQVRKKEEKIMKWIVLAGAGNTRKTWTLNEIVVALVRTCGARLISPKSLPTPHPSSSPTGQSYYSDGQYEILYKGRLIIVVTDGDTSQTVESGFKLAMSKSADVLISATRAKSNSGHIASIDSKIISGVADVYVIAALDHSPATQATIIRSRIRQIIDML